MSLPDDVRMLLGMVEATIDLGDYHEATAFVVDVFDPVTNKHCLYGPFSKDTAAAAEFGQQTVDSLAEATPDEPKLQFTIRLLFAPSS